MTWSMIVIPLRLVPGRALGSPQDGDRHRMCVTSGWEVSRGMTDGDRLVCPDPACSEVVEAGRVPGQAQVRVIAAHLRPATSSDGDG